MQIVTEPCLYGIPDRPHERADRDSFILIFSGPRVLAATVATISHGNVDRLHERPLRWDGCSMASYLVSTCEEQSIETVAPTK